MLSTKYNSQSSSITSYNYTDIAERTGVVNFYGFTSVASGAVTYKLSQNTPYSNYHSQISSDPGIETLINLTSTNGLQATLNFDLSAFNAPATLRGTAYINLPISGQNTVDYSVSFKIFIQKWDGSTATTIGSAQSPGATWTGATVYASMLNIPVAITKTQFKTGEILRIKIEVWGGSSDTTGDIAIGHDPKNRTTANYFTAGNPTTLNAYIPFELDL